MNHGQIGDRKEVSFNSPDDPITQLLKSRGTLKFAMDEGVENGEDVLAVGKDPLHRGAIPRVLHGLAPPAFQDLGRDVDILAQLLKWITSQKETIEKCRLVLRLGQIRITAYSHVLTSTSQQPCWLWPYARNGYQPGKRETESLY